MLILLFKFKSLEVMAVIHAWMVSKKQIIAL